MTTSSCACGRTIDPDRGDLACPTCQAMTCASCIERGQHECPEPARFVADDSSEARYDMERCLFPDEPCEMRRHGGSGYCEPHLRVMRARRSREWEREQAAKDRAFRRGIEAALGELEAKYTTGVAAHG